MKRVIELKTSRRSVLVNITQEVRKIIKESGVEEGFCILYVPHTTAGILINEGADPDVVRDIIYALDKVFPWEDKNYKHTEGNSSAHIKSAIVGNSRVVLIEGGEPLLGTWESVFFAEFDGPRSRRVIVKIVKA